MTFSIIFQSLAAMDQPADPATPVAEKAGAVVEATVDVLSFLAACAIGAAIGMIAVIVVMAISAVVARRYKYYMPVHTSLRHPMVVLFVVVGAWIGFGIALDRLDEGTAPTWLLWVNHAFFILVIISAAWAVANLVNGLVESVYLRTEYATSDRAARIETQVQIIHRVVAAIIWIVALGAALLTFPAARTAGTSLLASAGLFSVVAGLAAQSVLGNVFAGLQLAFSDSMRVGDVVVFEDNTATVEEITLTYVVLAVWDGRRIVVPSSEMTSKPFENWTRRSPEMMGIVEWQVDWTVPVKQARKQLQQILNSTDLWDGRVGILQLSEVSHNTLVIRAIVSAENAGSIFDLKHYVREAMVQWIQEEAPQAMPHSRRIVDDAPNFAEVTEATAALVRQRLAHNKLPEYKPDSSDSVAPDTSSTTVISVDELERFARTPLSERVGDKDFQMGTDSEEFIVIPQDDDDDDAPAGYQSAIFHGSEEADKRAEQYAGPGEEVYEERNRKIRQTTDSLKKVDAPASDAGAASVEDGE